MYYYNIYQYNEQGLHCIEWNAYKDYKSAVQSGSTRKHYVRTIACKKSHWSYSGPIDDFFMQQFPKTYHYHYEWIKYL